MLFRSGTYHLSDDGELTFLRVTNDWHEITLLLGQVTTYDPQNEEEVQAVLAASLRAQASIDTVGAWVRDILRPASVFQALGNPLSFAAEYQNEPSDASENADAPTFANPAVTCAMWDAFVPLSFQAYEDWYGGEQEVLMMVADAKARLAPVLSPAQREQLARWTAERVLAAAGDEGWGAGAAPGASSQRC